MIIEIYKYIFIGNICFILYVEFIILVHYYYYFLIRYFERKSLGKGLTQGLS